MTARRFPLAAIEEEIAIKEASLTAGYRAHSEAFLSQCARELPSADVSAVRDALAYLRVQASISPNHPSVPAYIEHPIRVASFALALVHEPNLETVEIGLFHNVYEVCGLDENVLERAGFSKRLATAVRLLTIDRARETDPVYLRGFHDDMVAFGPPLPVVRSVDKLDNLLGLAILEDGQVRDNYIDLAERFVLPLAQTVDGRLGRFFADVVAYQRAAGCQPAVRRHYERFAASADE